MILRSIIAVLLLLCGLAGGAQVRPDQFPVQAAPDNANFEVYSQKGGLNRRAQLIDLKKYFTPDVVQAWQAFTFTDSIGVADSLRMQFLKDVNGRVFYVDKDGDALLIRDTAAAQGRVFLLATVADTSTVTAPVMGDVGIVGADTLLFYETTWVPFTKGAGGIYSGSGTVPANTQSNFLGAVRFHIDTLGSFSVGDLDTSNTGAIISISNDVGQHGKITVTSGSGATSTGQLQINNYYLPGTTPTGESLPTGSYMWIVNQAGAKAGTSSTGWLMIDSLLNGYPTGSGTANTLPMWATSTTLGNSSLSEASGVLSSSLTGALKLPAGTDAQDPVWAAGMLRYNTTTGGFQGYNTAERYLPWASANNFTSGHIPYSDGSELTTSDRFRWADGTRTFYVRSTSGTSTHPIFQLYRNNGTSLLLDIREDGKVGISRALAGDSPTAIEGRVRIYTAGILFSSTNNGQGIQWESAGGSIGVDNQSAQVMTIKAKDTGGITMSAGDISTFRVVRLASRTRAYTIGITGYANQVTYYEGSANNYNTNKGPITVYRGEFTPESGSSKEAGDTYVTGGVPNMVGSIAGALYLGSYKNGTNSDDSIRVGMKIAANTGLPSLPQYGSGTITGTPTYYSAWDTNGKFIETTASDIVAAAQDNVKAEVSINTTAIVRSFLPVNCSGGAITVTPPAAPVAGDWFSVSDSRASAATNNITIDFVGATVNLHGASANYVISTNADFARFTYIDATVGWVKSN